MKAKNDEFVILEDVFIRVFDVKGKEDDEISKKSYTEVKRLANDVYGVSDWKIVKDRNYKPFFMNKDYYLSISHTDELVVVGVCKGRNIGIDVEKIHKIGTKIIEKYYSKSEKKEIEQEIDCAELVATRIWTSKEAYSKCLGTGLTKEVLMWDSNSDMRFLLRTIIYNNYVISICVSKEVLHK